MNISAFNDSSMLRKVTYSIDGKLLGVVDIISTALYWSKDNFVVSGTLLIKDNIDTANLLPLNSKNVLEMYAEDGFGEFFFRKFILSDVKEVFYKDRFKALQFELVDRLSFTMMNTFISKSYKDKKLSDIFNDYSKQYKWESLIDSQSTMEVIETDTVHPYITVPQDRNFLEWFKSELTKEGLTMYQTRKEVKIGVKKEDLLPSKLEKIPYSFSQLHDLAEHPFRIHEHKTIFNPILKQLQNSPIKSNLSFDFSTKSMPSIQSTFKDVFDGIKTSTSAFNDLQSTIGEKLQTITNRETSTVKTSTEETYLKNSTLSIVVTGNFKYNKIYQNADVVLIGNLEHKQGQNEGDVIMSGVYTIVDIKDRLVSSRFFQLITLARADFQENS